MTVRLMQTLIAAIRYLCRQRKASDDAPKGGVLVMQPLPGIGDMVWHIPHVHALAAAQGPLTVLTKARSQAGDLLVADSSVKRLIFLQRPGRHEGVIGSLRLAWELRQECFSSAWLFHGSVRYACLLLLAGIPLVHGYGRGGQRYLLNGVMLPVEHLRDHPVAKADLLLRRAGITLSKDDVLMTVAPAEQKRVQQDYGHLLQPWIALGIGSSESRKQWGEQNFVRLVCSLREQTKATVFLLGGPAEQSLGKAIAEHSQRLIGYAPWQPQRSIAHTAAILRRCQLYIGNDTGALNMAAALGVPCIGLFGASSPLQHSDLIQALTSPNGQGMAGITPAQVTQIALIKLRHKQRQYLARQCNS